MGADVCFFLFVFGHTARHVGSFVPWPGIYPKPPALGIRSLNHWTIREVSDMSFFASDWKGETLTQVFQSKTELQKAFLTEIMGNNLYTWNKPADKLPCNLKNSDVLVLGNVDNLLDKYSFEAKSWNVWMRRRGEIQRKQKRNYNRNMTSTLRQHHKGKVLTVD